MKKLYSVLIVASLLLAIMPMVMAVSVGSGITPSIEVEKFAPKVWMCDNRVVYDDATEPGRISEDNQELVERINNYAFEGEQIQWDVLVMDKNKIDQNIDVYATVGDSQGEGNDIEVNCYRIGCDQLNITACNARIDEERITTCVDDIMDGFRCVFTVETPESMYGQYWVTVEAMDGEGMTGTMAENEYWFLNPVIALSIDGDMEFTEVRPDTYAYSSTMLVGNDADDSSGVMLDMFISGTDFYDSSSQGTRCLDPTTGLMTNQLVLGDGDSECDSTDPFCYYATNGAYSTQDDGRSDAEGYVGIDYGIGFNNPDVFYNNNEIIQAQLIAPYYVANILAPGAEMAITFRLNLPQPCTGDFDTGSIYFWGEAI